MNSNDILKIYMEGMFRVKSFVILSHSPLCIERPAINRSLFLSYELHWLLRLIEKDIYSNYNLQKTIYIERIYLII